MITSKLLDKYNLGYAISQVSDGNLSYTWGESSEKVLYNRRKFWGSQGLELKNSIGMMLTHSTSIQIVSQSDVGKGTLDNDDYYNVDALITNTKGLVLYVLTADCCPIIILDRIKNVLAVAHCSWKNTDKEFIKLVITRMIHQYRCRPSEMVAFIAPAIHQQSYCFPYKELKQGENWRKYINKNQNKACVDVVGYNIDQMIDIGLPKNQIEDSGIDTFTSKNFFSHRRSVVKDEPEGRFATLAWLK